MLDTPQPPPALVGTNVSSASVAFSPSLERRLQADCRGGALSSQVASGLVSMGCWALDLLASARAGVSIGSVGASSPAALSTPLLAARRTILSNAAHLHCQEAVDVAAPLDCLKSVVGADDTYNPDPTLMLEPFELAKIGILQRQHTPVPLADVLDGHAKKMALDPQ